MMPTWTSTLSTSSTDSDCQELPKHDTIQPTNDAGYETLMMRVGLGHDTHRLGPDRPLILGGVRIEHDRGLIGHSDADVVLHAVTDALLGAAGLGDIGDAFPDTDPAYKDRDSAFFIEQALQRLQHDNWKIVNLDVTLFAQQPKLGPHKGRICQRLAELFASMCRP